MNRQRARTHGVLIGHAHRLLFRCSAIPYSAFRVLQAPVLQYRSNHQVSKKSAVTNLLFKGSQSVCSGRQGEQITPCHNSRTKLRMKLLNVEKQDNIEFYLSCKFQPSTFNVRCKTDVTDGMPDKQTNKQTNERTTVCRGSAPRHNKHVFRVQSAHVQQCLVLSLTIK